MGGAASIARPGPTPHARSTRYAGRDRWRRSACARAGRVGGRLRRVSGFFRTKARTLHALCGFASHDDDVELPPSNRTLAAAGRTCWPCTESAWRPPTRSCATRSAYRPSWSMRTSIASLHAAWRAVGDRKLRPLPVVADGRTSGRHRVAGRVSCVPVRHTDGRDAWRAIAPRRLRATPALRLRRGRAGRRNGRTECRTLNRAPCSTTTRSHPHSARSAVGRHHQRRADPPILPRHPHRVGMASRGCRDLPQQSRRLRRCRRNGAPPRAAAPARLPGTCATTPSARERRLAGHVGSRTSRRDLQAHPDAPVQRTEQDLPRSRVRLERDPVLAEVPA